MKLRATSAQCSFIDYMAPLLLVARSGIPHQKPGHTNTHYGFWCADESRASFQPAGLFQVKESIIYYF